MKSSRTSRLQTTQRSEPNTKRFTERFKRGAIEALVTEIERLGLRLSATRLADGKVRLNRWRTPDGVINAQQIEDLWASQIGVGTERATRRQSCSCRE